MGLSAASWCVGWGWLRFLSSSARLAWAFSLGRQHVPRTRGQVPLLKWFSYFCLGHFCYYLIGQSKPHGQSRLSDREIDSIPWWEKLYGYIMRMGILGVWSPWCPHPPPASWSRALSRYGVNSYYAVRDLEYRCTQARGLSLGIYDSKISSKITRFKQNKKFSLSGLLGSLEALMELSETKPSSGSLIYHPRKLPLSKKSF